MLFPFVILEKEKKNRKKIYFIYFIIKNKNKLMSHSANNSRKQMSEQTAKNYKNTVYYSIAVI